MLTRVRTYRVDRFKSDEIFDVSGKIKEVQNRVEFLKGERNLLRKRVREG